MGPKQTVLATVAGIWRNGSLQVFTNILTDRGSKYAVSGGLCKTKQDARGFIKLLTKDKKFAKATHHSWGLVSRAEGPIKNDDGEAGAGALILRILEQENLHDHIVVVTRWYGGKHLGGDRFRHVQTSVRTYLDRIGFQGSA